jgi:hypothetical protein
MKSLLLAFVGILFIPVLASAQTVTFTQQNVASVAQAQGFTYRLYVTPSGSTTQGPAIVATGITCTGTAPTVNCTGTVAAANATVTGAKSVITAQDAVNGSTESAQSAPFSPGANVPTGLKVQ